MEYVFLASDNDAAVHAFREALGNDKLIIYKRMRTEIGKEYKKDTEKDMYQSNHLFQTSLDYLTEMVLLSNCNAIIGSITSGLRFAVVLGAENIQHLEIVSV